MTDKIVRSRTNHHEKELRFEEGAKSSAAENCVRSRIDRRDKKTRFAAVASSFTQPPALHLTD
jgi:hypothetical protein